MPPIEMAPPLWPVPKSFVGTRRRPPRTDALRVMDDGGVALLDFTVPAAIAQPSHSRLAPFRRSPRTRVASGATDGGRAGGREPVDAGPESSRIRCGTAGRARWTGGPPSMEQPAGLQRGSGAADGEGWYRDLTARTWSAAGTASSRRRGQPPRLRPRPS